MKLLWHLSALLPLMGQVSFARPVGEHEMLVARQTNPLNPILSIITSLPPASLLLNGTIGALSNMENLVSPFSGGPAKQTDIASGKPCAAMTLVFARGTTEPGNMGVLAGPQLVNAIKSAMPGTSLNVQGVEYAASIQGYLAGGGADGTASMTSLVQKNLQNCPQSKIVMAGYSQGGQVVHNAAGKLGSSVMSKISSVVIFGDPKSNTTIPGAEKKTMVVCHDGDNICSNGDLILPPHLTYGLLDAPKAGAFVAQMAKAPAAKV